VNRLFVIVLLTWLGAFEMPGVANTYDRRGRIWTITQNGILTTKGYNGANQLTSETYSGGVLNGLIVNHTYDTLLRRSSSSVSGYTGTLNNYTYDTANRLSTVGDGTYSATYTYLANSPLVSKITDKQTTSTRLTINKQYDFLDQLNLTRQPIQKACQRNLIWRMNGFSTTNASHLKQSSPTSD
jgi:hypothetical protein